ncbi:(R)-mandelonitrile lyase [Ralstonia pseudosolanacearum]|uniref:Cupin 2 conserved barrel domain protein n=1 Tax=Ralstonia solanacearum TaxID=305 RepID=A0A0S4TY79_RALSL|nr:cupin domain-containing protein [Ralstonia pseudosolanacearum]OAI78736.1 TetR family transcriptional regulator [Ralstonia solanacearum]QCX50360.1 cupin domain-containing protein [Ralstonia pseudosolanacearum]CUV14969.1 Cupin 2 conserved barrel domain protein [Ralstonia solanacearum]
MKHVLAAAASAASIASAPVAADSIEIRHSGDVQAVAGQPGNFTGNSEVRALLPPNESTRASVGLVDFAAGARTTWHSHPAGQLLIVTAGKGWIQEDGKTRRVIEAGDVVWIPTGVKHWHGATDKTAMSHVALTYMVDGKNVDWLEPVSDEQYHQ